MCGCSHFGVHTGAQSHAHKVDPHKCAHTYIHTPPLTSEAGKQGKRETESERKTEREIEGERETERGRQRVRE